MREAASSIAPSGRITRPEASPKQPADRGISPVTRTRDAGDAARRAEPRGIGSAGARDPLAREVKLLGALLGQVIVEQEGPELFELVEQLRRAAIRGRRSGPEETIEGALHALDGRPATELLAVARAFTAYFLLINLAEEKHRLRTLRKRERSSRRAPLGRWDRCRHPPSPPRRHVARRRARAGAPHAPDARSHRPSHGGATPDRAGGAAAAVSAPRSIRRSATDPLGGPRPAPSTARGDQPALADEPGARPSADPARRGAGRDGLLRRDALRRHSAAVSGPPGNHRRDRYRCGRGAVSPLGLVDRERSRRASGRDGRGHAAHDADPGGSHPARLSQCARAPSAVDRDLRRTGRRGGRLSPPCRADGPAVSSSPGRSRAPIRRTELPTGARDHRRTDRPNAGAAGRRPRHPSGWLRVALPSC